MCRWFKTIPKPNLVVLGREPVKLINVLSVFSTHGITHQRRPNFNPDNYLYCATNWEELVPTVVIPANAYVEEGFDCDEYAKKASVDLAFLYKLNGCVQVWGQTSSGYHAFCAVIYPDLIFRLFEPNAGFEHAGELFRPGEHGYIPYSWIE